MENFTDILTKKYGVNEPILMEDIIAAFPEKTRQTLYRWIERAMEDGLLARFDRGVYYLPSKTRFGQSRLLPEQVVRRKWIEQNGEVIGYISGAGLANSVGVTEQVPAMLEVTTNRETTRVRDIPPFGGWKSIKLRRPRTQVTAQNVQALRFLDVITDEQVGNMGEYSFAALRSLAEKAGRDQIYDCATYYPAKTAKQLIECERNNVFA